MRPSRALALLLVATLFAQPPSPITASASITPLALESMVGSLERQASEDGALGFYTDLATSEFVIVIPASLAATFIVPPTAIPQRIRVESRDIERSDIALASSTLSELFTNQNPRWTHLGYYFDPSTGVVEAAGNLEPSIVVPLLGKASRFIHYSQAAGPVATTKYADYAPFWGGDELYAGGATCTAGFAVHDATNGYMVTAAHCYQAGAHVYSPGSNYEIGQVVKWLAFLNADSDLALLGNKTYDGYIYTGGLNDSTAQHVKGSGDPSTGLYAYCYSPYSRVEQCNYAVITLDSTQCFSDSSGNYLGCANNVMVFKNASGSAQPVAGDSGSPFYIYGSGGVYARGIVNAGSNPPCGSSCQGYGFRWSIVSSKLAVSITTS